MERGNYKCPKCGNESYETDEIRTTGGNFSKFFNVQNKKFVAVTCTQCQYTEFYKGKTSMLGNVIDFFGN